MNEPLHSPSPVNTENRGNSWNVLTSPWLEVMTPLAEPQILSPIEALRQAGKIRCLCASSPLDLFAAHRFLLTSLYWAAEEAGGVHSLRTSLLGGEVPLAVIDWIEAKEEHFVLFDGEAPFLQDPALRDPKVKRKSVGELYAEFAVATNIAHFHHGDDEQMGLCPRCVTKGMLRVIPWSQAGGAGITPSVHNAPPIMSFAVGNSLAETLALNLVVIPGPPGEPVWTGHFTPANKQAQIPYLEAFTWNPRRIFLPPPEEQGVCWGCGELGVRLVGKIVYAKNETTGKRNDKKDFEWADPAAFYSPNVPYKTTKSYDEALAVLGQDLGALVRDEDAPTSSIVVRNAEHQAWEVIIPCTNPANNKTFDHRLVEVHGGFRESLAAVPEKSPPGSAKERDGWKPRDSKPSQAQQLFVFKAVEVLTDADWTVMASAAFKDMHEVPGAFDVLAGILWGMRSKRDNLSKNVAWLMLKLMACVPAKARKIEWGAAFNPLKELPKRQWESKERKAFSNYPLSFPRGPRLETALRNLIIAEASRRSPKPIDWPGLCQSLDDQLNHSRYKE